MQKQCTYISKQTGLRCTNHSSYGCRTCWLHGARKPETIRRGAAHPNYKHGRRTLEAQNQSSEQSLRLRYLEDISHLIGLIQGSKTRGRKPKGYARLTLPQLLAKLT